MNKVKITARMHISKVHWGSGAQRNDEAGTGQPFQQSAGAFAIAELS